MSDWTSAEPLDAAQGPAVCLGDPQTLSSQLLLLLALFSFLFCFVLINTVCIQGAQQRKKPIMLPKAEDCLLQ